MKTLCLFILTFLVLYNPKVEAAVGEIDIRPMDNYDLKLDTIEIYKKKPLIDIDLNLSNFRELIYLYKNFQEYDTELTQKILQKIQNRNTLSGNDLYLIKRTFQTYFKFNQKIFEFASLYQYRGTTIAKGLVSGKAKLPIVKAHLIWLTANVVVMEHTEAVHKILYLTDNEFRRIFKNSFTPSELSLEEKTTIKQLTEQINQLVENLEKLRFGKQIILVRETALEIKNSLADDEKAISLVEELQTNKVATDIAQGKKKFKLQIFGISDAAVSIFNKITNFLSGFFGNIAGSIRSRKGYLFESEKAIQIAKNALRPMDIILEKSPFILTDKLIPGHYGHAAIYLGTKTQLEEIGMWNHPDIIPHQDEIEAGNTIIEAVRPGVRLNSVEDFMNIDEYTIIRKVDGLMSSAQVAEQISRGIDQLGKDYDFNFDISTLDKIVCSELIYIVFGHVNWPTQYRLGRPTITPDDIGESLFMKNTRFKMTDYIVSTERHKIEKANLDRLADIYDYEIRKENGDPMQDPTDPSNSFWKKETKCYKVSKDKGPTSKTSGLFSRFCKTTYKEFYYEEQAGL
jgi:hypothetical protein